MTFSRTYRTVTAAAVAVTGLAFAGQAVAHTIPTAKAAPIAKRAAARTAKETNATSYRIGTCRRTTSHRYVCHVTYRYAKNRRCTADAVAMYASKTSTRIKSGTTNFVCY
jgi:hypothetical protein